MGWFSPKPKSPQDQVDSIKTDHLPDHLKPEKPEFSALGDLSNQLSAQKNLNGSSPTGENKPEKAKYQNEYLSQANTLERAAKHAKELDKSKNAVAAIEAARLEEVTKQEEQKKAVKQYEFQIKQAENEAIRIKGNEERETLKYHAQINKEKSDYDHRLAIQRDQAKMEVEQQTQEKILRSQEESIMKQEKLRRETIEYESKLRRDNDMAKAEAEARAKAIIDRENHDIKMKEIRLEQEMRQKGKLETTKIWINGAGDFLKTNFGSPGAALNSMQVLGMGLVVYFGVKEMSRLGGRMANKYLNKPVLIRETNRPSIRDSLNSIKQPRQTLKNIVQSVRKQDLTESTLLQRVFVSPEVTDKITDIGIGAQQTIQNGGYLRNILLHGPPGTGKTLFAKELAKHSNMKYAIVSGGDFAPLGSAAVTEIHNLWDWADRSDKGLILFIDEAEAFLQKRTNKHGKMSEDMRAAINAFLAKSGTESKRIMIVMATNQPDQLDSAVKDRCDSQVLFPLPGYPERLQQLSHYWTTNIVSGACQPKKSGLFSFFKQQRNLKISDEILDNQIEILKKVAEETEGLSGRGIFKLVTSWEQALYQSVEGTLTKDMIDKNVARAVEEMKEKQVWEELDQ